MAYEFKNLSDVDQLDQLSGSTTIMGFDNGKPVQFSTDKVGSVKTVNGSVPDENGNIELQTGGVSNWNNLLDKPFDENNVIKLEALPEGYPAKTLSETVLLEETTYTFTDKKTSTDIDSYYVTIYPSWYPFGVTKTVLNIVWDGVSYNNLTVQEFTFGNGHLSSSMYSDTGEPFCLAQGSMGAIYILSSTSGNHTISISEVITKCETLDVEFLPKTVPVITSGASNNQMLIVYRASDGVPTQWATKDVPVVPVVPYFINNATEYIRETFLYRNTGSNYVDYAHYDASHSSYFYFDFNVKWCLEFDGTYYIGTHHRTDYGMLQFENVKLPSGTTVTCEVYNSNKTYYVRLTGTTTDEFENGINVALYNLADTNTIVNLSDVTTFEHTHEQYLTEIPDTVVQNGATELILTSSTEGSIKQFKITVDDSGNLTATEVVAE